ncbi:unnamed protein product [Rotaria sp. Silwood2]|nr:unnamed protein product [Rotaria sp. Silwood2]CAF3601568.1 unnamed protein product [Rotaria sp. Silwood2]CAF4547746.1 unnamed protein product [Rotaria sp. Silwood2]CAF4868448.1 unnamed protein product [Rotaria sp. Silwood2]
MLNSILLNFTEIELTFDDRKEIFYLDNISRTLLSNICNILLIFKAGSEILSTDDFPTLHLVVPFLLKFLECCEVRLDDTAEITDFKTILLNKLDDKI